MMIDSSILAQLPGLSTEAQETLLAQSKTHHYAARETVWEQDTPVTYVGIVQKGRLRLSRTHENGRDVIVTIVGPGEPFGLSAVYDDVHSSVTVQALVASTVVALPIGAVVSLAETEPAFANSLMRVLAGQVNRLVHHMEQVALHSAEHRLGTYVLTNMLDETGLPHNTKLPAPKHVIAQHLGMTAETLSRAQRKLAQYGLHIRQNTVELAHDRVMCPFCDTFLVRRCLRGTDHDCPLNQQKNTAGTPTVQIENSAL